MLLMEWLRLVLLWGQVMRWHLSVKQRWLHWPSKLLLLLLLLP